ncbi:hypothetical protein Cni_G19781 [Canna indica]|uniref:Reverse transcriptase domain-containing protein n=1 Tax=Canna indica TaxID=4628 RepID=A0AAQ3KLY0_9LILI|nr:hypothetical protein Cni_G19781 [Canna indica]
MNDKNTKYFHSLAKFKKRNNAIQELLVDGTPVNDTKRMLGEFEAWYKDLWKWEDTALVDWNSMKQLNWKRIPQRIHGELSKDFSSIEIMEAMSSLGKGKAPGPDGFNLEFFLNFWSIIQDSYMAEIESLSESCSLPEAWRNTNLIFIPKIDNPRVVKEYRPIALCNVAYKILSKAIVNRIKQWIDKIISKEQTAIVGNKNLHDNILILSEVVNIISKSKRKKPFFIMKLDLEKAFDRVDWDAIKGICKCMNFPRVAISPHGKICNSGEIKVFKFKEISVSHIFFADDIIMIVKCCKRSVSNVKEVLNQYGEITNQRINFQKSELYFPGAYPSEKRKDICKLLGIKEGVFPLKYLGANVVQGKPTISIQRQVFGKAKNKLDC